MSDSIVVHIVRLSAAATIVTFSGCAGPRSLHTSFGLIAKTESRAVESNDTSTADHLRGRSRATIGESYAKGTPDNGWQDSADSSGNNAIQTLRIGAGSFRILIVGSLNGHDRTALRIMDEIAETVEFDAPIIGGFEVLLVRTLNPDGEQLRRVTNADGIRLDRSFPNSARSGSPVIDYRAARSMPVETRFLIETLDEFDPHRVVHLRSARDEGAIHYNSDAAGTAQRLSDWTGLTPSPINLDINYGGLDQYVTHTRNGQMLSILLPGELDPKDAWDRYDDALLTLLVSDVEVPKSMGDESEDGVPVADGASEGDRVSRRNDDLDSDF